jgi:tripartite-type tricarboxylate transporter receptor subunit TctC
MSESPEWKKELEENFWSNAYARTAELRKQMDRDNVQQRAVMVDLGLAKDAK